MITFDELKEKSKLIESKYNLNHFEVLQRFMFERILERISISKYNDNFILKGGLLLSSMLGVDNRTTKDMDTTIKGIDVSKDKMINILNEILTIDLKDGVKFNITNITDIREDDKYGGNKYHIEARFQSLKIKLEIDISTGDEITPRELKYTYPLMFEDRKILISTYNRETILSEKIETILRKGQYNSRMKDYYDVYIFLTKIKKDIDINILKKALINTFTKRETTEYLKDYKNILDGIKRYERIKLQRNNYTFKNNYAYGIEFIDIINILERFLDNIYYQIV